MENQRELTLQQEIAQRNKEIADKEQEIKEAKKRRATEQELFLLNHQLGVLESVGNPSVTIAQQDAYWERVEKARQRHSRN